MAKKRIADNWARLKVGCIVFGFGNCKDENWEGTVIRLNGDKMTVDGHGFAPTKTFTLDHDYDQDDASEWEQPGILFVRYNRGHTKVSSNFVITGFRQRQMPNFG